MSQGRDKRLRKARRVRSQTSAELHQLHDATINLRDALASPRSFPGLSNARVYDVLRCAPHMGDTGARKVLQELGIWPLDKLGMLPPSRREAIIAHLPPRAR